MVDPLILPKPIQEQAETPHRSRFVIEPLYPGYGTTLGNALRRILLSSLPGCAINAIAIDGVQHEFSSLSDVKEDVVDIMLNVKQVRFRMTGEHDEPVKAEIDAEGNGPVLASAFKSPTGVACVTPDMHIATITAPKGSFRLTAYIKRGRGFLAVEARDKDNPEIGTIAVDAIYSPVRHVAFTLDHVRVGQMTNYDKIVLVVETDGSITPHEAMVESLAIFRAQVAGLAFEGGLPAHEGAEAGVEDESAHMPDAEPVGPGFEEEVHDEEENTAGEAPVKKRGRKKKGM